MRLFSKKIKLGDYVYDKTNKNNHGKIISIIPPGEKNAGYYVFSTPSSNQIVLSPNLAIKITKQQHDSLIGNELDNTNPHPGISLGDVVMDTTTQLQGKVIYVDNRFFVVENDRGAFNVLKPNAELISATLGGRRKTLRSASKRRFRTRQ